jgi:hypothetical protein
MRLTCERGLREQVGAMRAGLSGIFGFLITFFPFLDACSLLDTEYLHAS